MTDRTVSIFGLYNDSLLTPDRELYQPGVLEDITLVDGYLYSGVITKLDINTNIRTFHEFDIWAEDDGGNRYNLLTKVRISPSVKVFDLVEKLASTKKIPFSTESKIGITLLTPDRWIAGDSVTIIGFAEETAYKVLDNNSSEAVVDLTYQRSITKPLTRVDDSPLEQGDEWLETNTGIEWYWESTLNRWVSKQIYRVSYDNTNVSTTIENLIANLFSGYDYLLNSLYVAGDRVSFNSTNYFNLSLIAIKQDTSTYPDLVSTISLGDVSTPLRVSYAINSLILGSDQTVVSLTLTRVNGGNNPRIQKFLSTLVFRLVKP